MKISIFSLFRDSENYIHKCLSTLDKIRDNSNFEFEYFFYENDSKDKTKFILEDWIQDKNGKIKSETLNAKKFGSTLHPERMILMSEVRNKMLKLGRESDSDYSIIFDSDVNFDSNIIDKFLKHKDLDFSMLTPNIRQDVPCKMGSNSKTSYYDSSILFDSKGMHTMTWSDNPFYEESDRELFENLKPIQVTRAFGGFVFLKTKTLLKVKWNSKGESEHFSFCDALRAYGKIYLIPEIQPSVSITQKNWDHENLVIEKQTKLLENSWNRFLLKNNSFSL